LTSINADTLGLIECSVAIRGARSTAEKPGEADQMIKDLVVNLSVDRQPTAADYAISIAQTFSAHITGVAFAYEAAVAPTVMADLPGDWVEAQRAESAKAATAAIAQFEASARRSELSADHRMLPATAGGAADLFGRIARCFDLSVVGQTDPDRPAPEELIIEGALFESGRPVVVVPYIQTQGLKLDRVLVCWDGSRTATRAIADSLPFLTRAKAIDVVIVADGRAKSDEIPGADIGQHLARHGLKIDVKRIVAPDVDVPNTILSYAADCSADFLVMGGYGHSRLREFVLGGATRGILTSMTVPALMSH
jgi:nucleotide-binding universal stress UspA family protein